jgi:hypothetical protein
MIHTELPKAKTPITNKVQQKKFISVISPDRILLNEKLLLSLMFGGMAIVLLSWAINKK